MGMGSQSQPCRSIVRRSLSEKDVQPCPCSSAETGRDRGVVSPTHLFLNDEHRAQYNEKLRTGAKGMDGNNIPIR
jgi:hypothetical protein